MKGSDVFGAYLKVEDLQGKEINVTIESVEMVTLPDKKEKPLMTFSGAKKGWVFGTEAWDEIKDLLGSDESDDWIGERICLWVDPKVTFQGRKVGGVRAKACTGTTAAAKPKPVEEQPPADAGDIPF